MNRRELVDLAHEHIRQASELLRQVGDDEEQHVSTAQSRLACAGRHLRRAEPSYQ